MDSVPDMDDLLDQLEAAEQAETVTNSDKASEKHRIIATTIAAVPVPDGPAFDQGIKKVIRESNSSSGLITDKSRLKRLSNFEASDRPPPAPSPSRKLVHPVAGVSPPVKVGGECSDKINGVDGKQVDAAIVARDVNDPQMVPTTKKRGDASATENASCSAGEVSQQNRLIFAKLKAQLERPEQESSADDEDAAERMKLEYAKMEEYLARYATSSGDAYADEVSTTGNGDDQVVCDHSEAVKSDDHSEAVKSECEANAVSQDRTETVCTATSISDALITSNASSSSVNQIFEQAAVADSCNRGGKSSAIVRMYGKDADGKQTTEMGKSLSEQLTSAESPGCGEAEESVSNDSDKKLVGLMDFTAQTASGKQEDAAVDCKDEVGSGEMIMREAQTQSEDEKSSRNEVEDAVESSNESSPASALKAATQKSYTMESSEGEQPGELDNDDAPINDNSEKPTTPAVVLCDEKRSEEVQDETLNAVAAGDQEDDETERLPADTENSDLSSVSAVTVAENRDVLEAKTKVEEDDEEVEEAEEDANGGDQAAENENAVIEEAQVISVVESTHDISTESDVTRLTESELQLGKVKPVWIADTDTLSCMLCLSKFTLILRRHHCRSCGRVLCAHCTSHKAVLPYMNEPGKKFKVCEPCFQTLERIEKYEKQRNCEQNDRNPADAPTTSTSDTVPIPRAKKSVLKVKAGSAEGENSPTEAHGRLPDGAKRCVTFRDGVNPGEGSSDLENSAGAPDPSSLVLKLKKQKNSLKRATISRRVAELRVGEESMCLLPKEETDILYTRHSDGTIERFSSADIPNNILSSRSPLVIAISRNLWCTLKICDVPCCGVGTAICITTTGMAFVGLDEILIAYNLDENDPVVVPVDIIRRIHDIYEWSLKPQNDSFNERMGIRAAHLRMPLLHHSIRSSDRTEFAHRDILLFRPTLQCFDNLLVPSSPFLVACFIHKTESLWALAAPNRLLYRIGLQASYYPTPVVNNRNRDAVYTDVVHTTVLKVFTDFRNWSYRMQKIHGSCISLQNNESLLVIPVWAKEEVKNLVESNKSMIAWALDFNADADGHLVCDQDDGGSYRTQVFTRGSPTCNVMGASFIVIDGAHKGSDTALTVNVVEDGIAIRFRPDAMSSFVDALCSGESYSIESPAMKFTLEWKDVKPRGFPGELVSPVDHSSLVGNYQYGLTESRTLSSLYSIPGVAEWGLRLVAVYNAQKGKFAPLEQSRVFAVSEQIAAQIAYTLMPFVDMLIKNSFREICIRVKVTSEEAEYVAAPWKGKEAEHSTWAELLDNQLVPGLFNVCSYVPSGFHAELNMAFVSTRPLP